MWLPTWASTSQTKVRSRSSLESSPSVRTVPCGFSITLREACSRSAWVIGRTLAPAPPRTASAAAASRRARMAPGFYLVLGAAGPDRADGRAITGVVRLGQGALDVVLDL